MAICLKTDFIFFQASKKSDLNKIVQILPFDFFLNLGLKRTTPRCGIQAANFECLALKLTVDESRNIRFRSIIIFSQGNPAF